MISDGINRREGIYIDDIQVTEIQLANISYSPTVFTETLNAGELINRNLYIRNSGMSNLVVNLEALELTSFNEDIPSLPQILNTWLFLVPTGDTIAAGDSLIAIVTLNSNAVSPGIHSGQIIIISNDPDSATSMIPVNLHVVGGCQYVPGDANGNGVFNGLDVGFSVNYLKGLGPMPPIACECSPHGTILAAADANGNCAYNGLDVTFSVNFLKGVGPQPLGCAECPPGI